MRRLMTLTLGALIALTVTASAQTAPAGPPTDRPTPAAVGPNFVDDDGDGICDNYQARGGRRGRGHGPGDGTGNRGVGPRDGTGYGAGSGAGTCGTCDGTGPKGKGARRGRRQ